MNTWTELTKHLTSDQYDLVDNVYNDEFDKVWVKGFSMGACRAIALAECEKFIIDNNLGE